MEEISEQKLTQISISDKKRKQFTSRLPVGKKLGPGLFIKIIPKISLGTVPLIAYWDMF